MSTATTNEYFDRFTHRWELTNPKPSENYGGDMVAMRILQIAIIGSVALSGTRTGTMIGETEMFSTFVEALGWGDGIKPYLNLIEALFGLATFEAAIFIGGYLWRDQAKEDRNPKYYYIFIGAAIIPALVANLAPAALLISESIFSFWLVLVNVVVGICTIVLAFIGGRVLEMVKFTFTEKAENKMGDWLDRRKAAWSRSPEYREMRQLETVASPVATTVTVTAEDIKSYLSNSGPQTIVALARGLNVQRNDIEETCKELIRSGQVKLQNKKLMV